MPDATALTKLLENIQRGIDYDGVAVAVPSLIRSWGHARGGELQRVVSL